MRGFLSGISAGWIRESAARNQKPKGLNRLKNSRKDESGCTILKVNLSIEGKVLAKRNVRHREHFFGGVGNAQVLLSP